MGSFEEDSMLNKFVAVTYDGCLLLYNRLQSYIFFGISLPNLFSFFSFVSLSLHISFILTGAATFIIAFPTRYSVIPDKETCHRGQQEGCLLL